LPVQGLSERLVMAVLRSSALISDCPVADTGDRALATRSGYRLVASASAAGADGVRPEVGDGGLNLDLVERSLRRGRVRRVP
jgi:hypothetical protein